MHLHPPSQYILGSSRASSVMEPSSAVNFFLCSFPCLLLSCALYIIYMVWGCSGEEESFIPNQFLNPSPRVPVVEVKLDVTHSNNFYGHGTNEEFKAPAADWSQFMAASSPSPSDLSHKNKAIDHQPPLVVDHSFECNSKGNKARVEPSSSQPPEKLGDRITSLQLLVCPFGKTDTASVLLEAIGYIRFLQGQIQALSSPNLDTASPNMRNQESEKQEHTVKDLRSRGFCLVPVSCTQQVGSHY